MKLLDELEEVKTEQQDSHPVFEGVPDKVKAMLVEEPTERIFDIYLGTGGGGGCWRKEEIPWLHLYALSRAVKELGGDNRFLLEVEIQRGMEDRTVDVLRQYPLPEAGDR